MFNLFSFSSKLRILHLNWFAFFLSFVVWFNHAPLLGAIRESFNLNDQQIKILLILNVAFTIPARILVGMFVDRFGPRLTYSLLLVIGAVLCFFFAWADSYQSLAVSRFLLGFVGAGFVVGIRMIGEWFPAREAGLAQGIYAGWGNFGSAIGALLLPTLALAFGGDDGWRYAVTATGVITLIYAIVYYVGARDTPKGSTYFKPNKNGGLEVSSRGDFFFYLIMNIPLYIAVFILVSKLTLLGLLSAEAQMIINVFLMALFAYQSCHIYHVNANIFKQPIPELYRYKFKQVAILSLAYLVTSGSELAVVSMLPLFFMDTFKLSSVAAGVAAGAFAAVVLFMRPLGGWISDCFGRKRMLVIVMIGLACGYGLMSGIDATWPLWLAVAACTACALFVHLGTGAVFAIVPLIQRRLTGQIAGIVGAYGNVGGVLYLAVLVTADSQIFFLTIACTAIVILYAVLYLDEPKGSTAEILPDGSVQLINVG